MLQRRGGGIIFGPVVRSHAHGLQKKVRRLGLLCALSVGCSTDVCCRKAFHPCICCYKLLTLLQEYRVRSDFL